MTEETKRIFSAPWAIEEEAPLAWYCVIDSKDSVVANDVRDQKTVNRLARLPELYDALFDSVLRICSTCIGSNLSDTPLDDIGRYCRANCSVHKYTALLKKARDGE